VLSASPAEVPGLQKAITEGRIDGSCYRGECACLVGTLGKLRGGTELSIPGLTPAAGRAAEAWFAGIRPGDTPDTSQVASVTLEWVNDWLARIRAAAPALPAKGGAEGGAA
jgi:hypothetical protein